MLFSNISLPFSDKTILPNISQGRLAAPLSIWRLCALYTLHAGAARPWYQLDLELGKYVQKIQAVFKETSSVFNIPKTPEWTPSCD
jgi:hypothetical protein